MTLRLLRIDTDGKGVRGIIFQPGQPVQHRQPVTIIENAEHLIPDGTYTLSRSMSPKFGKVLPLLNNVPNRAGIRIHTGTRPEHSTGCLLTTPSGQKTINSLITKCLNQNETISLSIQTIA